MNKFQFSLQRRLVAEALGTALLVATVVGSGIMAQSLTADTGLVLLANSLATGAVLVVLITALGPISGAHFNPAISFVSLMSGQLPARSLALYICAQLSGGLIGLLAAHVMFSWPLWQASLTARTGLGQWIAEAIAAFGLALALLAGQRFTPRSLPWLVGLYITSAYWFTASTSFANPAVTIARAFTNTFAGIRPVDAPAFVMMQLAGAVAAYFLMQWLLKGDVAGRSTEVQ